jgi:hypothetical protein
MKSTDRSILIGLGILGILACFWFLVLSPKRERASELDQQVENLESQVTQQEQLAAAAEEAQAGYEKNYARLIELGKAAPADGDTTSLLAQLTALSEESRTRFGSLTAESSASTAALPAAAQTTTDQNAGSGAPAAGASGQTATPAAAPAAGAAAPTTPAPATETSAASLPLGASVGPAGLGVLPYTLTFTGGFFEMADLLEGIDSQVGADGKATKVGGRLVTINGFTMSPSGQDEDLKVDLSITTYVLPDSQGLTAGASPAAPPATVPPATSVPTTATAAP